MQVTKTLRIRDLTVELNDDHITIATKRGVAVKIDDIDELGTLLELINDAYDLKRASERAAELEDAPAPPPVYPGRPIHDEPQA